MTFEQLAERGLPRQRQQTPQVDGSGQLQATLATVDAEPAPGVAGLQKLSQKHKQVLALVAQGIDRTTIGQAVDYVPEYITWLVRQPVCQEYLREMVGYNDSRLLALTERSVDVISEVMANGSHEDQLKAAKLQLTAIGKVGRAQAPVSAKFDEDRLERLAERLVALQSNVKERTLNESDGASAERIS